MLQLMLSFRLPIENFVIGTMLENIGSKIINGELPKIFDNVKREQNLTQIFKKKIKTLNEGVCHAINAIIRELWVLHSFMR